MNYKDYINTHLEEAVQIAKTIDREAIQKTIEILQSIREQRGRVFFLGVGGSAANASHAASDFRMTCNLEAYAPLDNIPQLTALTNDHGWENVFVYWLKNSRLCSKDALFIFSVGGGSEHTSKNLVLAMEYAKEVGAKICNGVRKRGWGKNIGYCESRWGNDEKIRRRLYSCSCSSRRADYSPCRRLAGGIVPFVSSRVERKRV